MGRSVELSEQQLKVMAKAKATNISEVHMLEHKHQKHKSSNEEKPKGNKRDLINGCKFCGNNKLS